LYPYLGLPLIFWDTYSALYAASMPENVVCPGKGNVVSMCGGGGGASPLNFLPFALTHSQSLTVTHSQSLTHSRQCNGVTPTTNNQQPTNSESLPSHSHSLTRVCVQDVSTFGIMWFHMNLSVAFQCNVSNVDTYAVSRRNSGRTGG